MFFLLAQIFPLLLLAAVLGAVLAYWWLKNRQMDITESYELITERLAAIEARPEPAAREDYEAGMALISSAVRSLRMPDMEPVNQRLAALEASVSGFTVPETDLAPLHGKFDGVDATLSGIASRLADIEGRMTAQDQRLAALDERLSGLGTRIADVDPRFAKLDERLTALDTAVASIANAVGELRNTDLQPVEARFGKIEETLSAFKIPEVDLGPLHSGLARLDLTIAGLDRPATDLGPVQTRLSEFETRLTQLGERLEAAQKRDMDKLSADITAVASGVSGIEMPDMGAVYQRLVSVEHAIATFTIPEPNLAPMYERLAALEETVSAIRTAMPRTPDFAPVERRIASLQEAFLTQTPTDFTPVLAAVQAIEAISTLKPWRTGLTPLSMGLQPSTTHSGRDLNRPPPKQSALQERGQRPLPSRLHPPFPQHRLRPLPHRPATSTRSTTHAARMMRPTCSSRPPSGMPTISSASMASAPCCANCCMKSACSISGRWPNGARRTSSGSTESCSTSRDALHATDGSIRPATWPCCRIQPAALAHRSLRGSLPVISPASENCASARTRGSASGYSFCSQSIISSRI